VYLPPAKAAKAAPVHSEKRLKTEECWVGVELDSLFIFRTWGAGRGVGGGAGRRLSESRVVREA
jgi:hypothetical protein